MEIQIAHIVTLYAIVLGPLKVIGPFALSTAHADPILTRQIANKAFMMSLLITVIVAVVGGYLMSRFHLSVGNMSIIMAFFLANWAIDQALGKQPSTPSPETPDISLAIMPITIPWIIPPQGVPMLVLSSSLVIEGYEAHSLYFVGALLLAIMVLNWVAMILAKPIVKFTGMIFWVIVLHVWSIIILGLAMYLFLYGLRDLGVLA